MEGRSKFLDPSSVPLKQRSEGGGWKALLQITQALLVLAMIAAIFVCFLPVIRQSQRLQQQKEENAQRIAEANRINRQLQQQFELLKNNPEYIERTARDKLNLGRPGEIILRFDPYSTNSTSLPR